MLVLVYPCDLRWAKPPCDGCVSGVRLTFALVGVNVTSLRFAPRWPIIPGRVGVPKKCIMFVLEGIGKKVIAPYYGWGIGIDLD